MSEKTVLVDTNVWVSFYCGSRPDHLAVRSFILRSIEKDAVLLYVAPSIKDVYYLLAADAKREYRGSNGLLTDSAAAAANEYAWGCISNMVELATAMPCGHTDVSIAQKFKKLHGDLEDDLVIAAAIRSKADVLVTSDENLRRHAPVAAMCVDDAIKFLDT